MSSNSWWAQWLPWASTIGLQTTMDRLSFGVIAIWAGSQFWQPSGQSWSDSIFVEHTPSWTVSKARWTISNLYYIFFNGKSILCRKQWLPRPRISLICFISTILSTIKSFLQQPLILILKPSRDLLGQHLDFCQFSPHKFDINLAKFAFQWYKQIMLSPLSFPYLFFPGYFSILETQFKHQSKSFRLPKSFLPLKAHITLWDSAIAIMSKTSLEVPNEITLFLTLVWK